MRKTSPITFTFCNSLFFPSFEGLDGKRPSTMSVTFFEAESTLDAPLVANGVPVKRRKRTTTRSSSYDRLTSIRSVGRAA